MNMADAVQSVLGKYATFQGRASRSEYWWYILAFFLFAVVVSIIEGAVLAPMLGFEAFDPSAGNPMSMIISLALFLPTLAVAIRRLHDIDRSGWWYLIGFIPLIGFLVLIYWYVQPGSDDENRFGPPPAA